MSPAVRLVDRFGHQRKRSIAPFFEAVVAIKRPMPSVAEGEALHLRLEDRREQDRERRESDLIPH
jgi:hypothetical protein